MTCANPEIGAMITRYEFGLLNQEERKQFEAHLLSCDACFADFYEFAPVAQAMKAHPRECLEALQARPGWGTRIKQFFQAVLDDLQTFLEPLPRTIRIPAFALATVSVVAFALFLIAPQWQYADLAEIARIADDEFPTVLRSTRAPTPLQTADSLFQHALYQYKNKNDSVTVRLLQEALALAPAQAAAQFFLGVSLLHAGAADSAIAHLQQAAALQDSNWEEASRWYLSQAYLKKNEGEAAQNELQIVAAAEGRRAEGAKALLEKIRQRQAQNWWQRYFQESKQR